MFTLNDLPCKCGHTKYEHVFQKTSAVWCSFNQKTCECWKYEVRPMMTDKQADMYLAEHGTKVKIEQGRLQ